MKTIKYVGLIFVVILAFFFIYIGIEPKFKNKNKVESDDEDNIKSPLEEKVEQIMSGMTLEEKIGQMLIVFYGNDVFDEEFSNFFNEVQPSGVILMKDNYSTYEGTKKLVSDMKNASNIPLIVSTDQEGGRVQRLQFLDTEGYTDIPDMLSLGEKNDKELAYEVGKLMAEELRTLGINVVYAPVMDVFSNPSNTVIGNRSFGSDPNVVKDLSLSLARGLEDNGVIATYKHFPGHGDTETDSHVNLPIINKSYEDISNLELIPFKEAISNNAKLIMIGHIALPQITGDEVPATLSKTIVTDILKEKLGYNGLVITDALNMKALTNTYSNEEISIKAVQAGVDLLLFPVDANVAIDAIRDNISEERINESVKKILLFKYEYLDVDNTLPETYIGSEEHKKIVDKIIYD